MAIKFRKIDADTVRRLVKNANSQIRYWNNKADYNYKNYLPQIMNVRQVTEKLKSGSRKQFNDWVRQMNNFLKRGSKDSALLWGQEVPKFIKHESMVRFNRINKNRANLRKELDISIYKGNLHIVSSESLYPKKPYSGDDNVSFRKYLSSLYAQGDINYLNIANERYRNNYIKALHNAGYSQEYIEAISKYVNRIDTNKFYRESLSNPLLEIKFIYDIKANPNTPQILLNELLETFGSFSDIDYTLLGKVD